MNRRTVTKAPADEPIAGIEPHLSVTSVARVLDCTSEHLRNLRLQNKGPRWTVTTDGTVRYPASAVRAYLGITGDAA